MKVAVGNLMPILGTVRFTDANTEVDSVVVIVIVSVAVILLLLSAVTFLVCVITRNRCNLNIFKRKLGVNTNVDMYASPAYGTHQVFAEPGLDHIYDTIDVELQSAPPMESSDDKGDQDSYLTMAGDRDQDQEMINVQPSADQDDTPFNNSNNTDDDSHSEYENDDSDNVDYLQLQHEDSGPATDHSYTTDL